MPSNRARRALTAGLVVALGAGALPALASQTCVGRSEPGKAGAWEALPVTGIDTAGTNWTLAADEGDPRLVVVGDSAGVLVTRDGGCSWRRAATYADYVATVPARTVDVVVAGTGRDRSLHVLVSPWVKETPARLLSSYDDGATWTALDAPIAAGPDGWSSLSLTASPAAAGVVYLLARHPFATGAIYATDGREGWRWQSVTSSSAAEGACAPGPTCAGRPVEALHADPRRPGELWALSTDLTEPGETLAHSSDEALTWEHRSVPPNFGGFSLMDVGPRSIMLLGPFGDFAVTRDAGRSWAVGDYPRVTSPDSNSTGVFDAAHFDSGRAAAIVLGTNPDFGWAGNLLVFDGRRWTDASPIAFAGYDRTDAEGNELKFIALAGTESKLLGLSSRGELMSFTR